MPRTFAENLEPRRLLAGITLFAPAWTGGVAGWIATAENGITADLGGPQNVPRYTLTIAPNASGTLVVQGVAHVAGTATPQANNPGQILVTIDYTAVSTNPDYPASEVAGLVTNFMENDPVDGVTWAALPIHLISTSIGTAVTDAIAQSLDSSGIWVDQETYLDPDPDTSAPFNDPLNTVYDNVEFADDYWRTNGSNPDTNPSGHPISGAYNLNLTWVQNDFAGYALAHLAPPSYYVGTIEPSLIGTSDADGPILSAWYGNGSTPATFPSATQTGFLYTNIAGGTRPISGLWTASGGTGVRTTVTHTGLQWPNVSDVDPTSTTATSAGTLDINFIHEDQSEADNITFYLDSDQNPYDGTGIEIGSLNGLASSTSISSGSINASLAGVAPGTYYVCAEAADSSSLARFNYSLQTITITAPPGSGSLSGVQSVAAKSYNLTTLGTSDWAAWGLGGNGSAFDHDAAGGSQISNVTAVGSGGYGAYWDSSRDVSWTNGTPAAAEAGEDDYIWANNAIGAGFTFTVPASTTTQTLYVYLGGYSSGGTLTAHLSDGSAADYVTTLSGSSLYSDVDAITYRSDVPGQKLIVTYVKSQTINGAGGSVDLIAAWLGGAATNSAPVVVTSPTSVTAASGATVSFTAAASGNPAPTVQWQISTNGGTSFTNIAGATSTTYSLTAAAGENGDEYQAVFTNSVNQATTAPATLTVTTPPSGVLSGVQSTAAASYNLTTLGTSDWAHWGLGGNGSAFDHKASGGSQISNVTRLGTGGGYGGYSDSSRSVSWTDGTPVTTQAGDDGYIWANNALGAGYSFTVPAGTTAQTLYVYLGGYSSGGTLTAHLSDGSAADYVVSLSGSSHYSDLVAITYKAASAGQTLTLSYVKSQTINGAGGSVDLMAAWLEA